MMTTLGFLEAILAAIGAIAVAVAIAVLALNRPM